MKHPCGWPGRAHRPLLPGVDVDVFVNRAGGSGTGRCTGAGTPRRRQRRPCPTSPRRRTASWPSAVAPARIFAYADGRLPPARCSSWRSSISFTGAFASFASFAQTMPCTSGPNLLPNPPPMCSQMTRTFALRDAERLGEAFARAVHRLRRHPRGELVAVPLAHAALCLEADVRLHLRAVGPLDDVSGRLDAGLDVSGRLGIRRLDVPALEDGRRLGAHRLLDGREVTAASRTGP